MTWEEAAAANEKNPKKIFVDVYTEWCGWCKKMDQTTFTDPSVVELMTKDFYAVKLDAEQLETIHWRDMDFKWTPGGRGGTNKLAYELLDGAMSFPSFVLLDSAYARIAISPGYKTGDAFLKELKYAAEEIYKKMDWPTYLSKT
jgi:thioredoxin-related protein